MLLFRSFDDAFERPTYTLLEKQPGAAKVCGKNRTYSGNTGKTPESKQKTFLFCCGKKTFSKAHARLPVYNIPEPQAACKMELWRRTFVLVLRYCVRTAGTVAFRKAFQAFARPCGS
jgi:hypothetical protein